MAPAFGGCGLDRAWRSAEVCHQEIDGEVWPRCNFKPLVFSQFRTAVDTEVNSQARADAIRKTIETALGEDVRYRASEIQSPERMLADLQAARGASGGAASEEHNRLAELPEVREKISAMMAAHWEHWVDQPIPILGNRTPMEAVKDPAGREIVELLVMQAERTGRMPTDEAVFRRLRERLGLVRSRSQSTRGSSASS